MDQDRIDAERLDAAQREYDRHARVRLAMVASLKDTAERGRKLAEEGIVEGQEVRALMCLVESVAEALDGEWVRSPREMLQLRQNGMANGATR